jgi:hypothetical protein
MLPEEVFLTLPCFFGAGASPNVQRKDDLWTPLFVAAMLGRTQVANMLLQVSFSQEIKQKIVSRDSVTSWIFF